MMAIKSVALVGLGRWDEAKEILNKAPSDPSKRDRVVRAAIALHDMEFEHYYHEREQWKDKVHFDKQIYALLSSSNTGVRLLALPIQLSY